MIQKLVFYVSIFVCLNAHGQGTSTYQKIPDYEFQNVFNYKSNTLRFTEFKGKAIILDFWEEHCLPCLAAFPKLQELQEKFSDRLQIVLVNQTSKDSTINFFKARKNIKVPNLPFITGDSILNETFTHSGVPFHVWIDQNGFVRYLSKGYTTSPENIEEFLRASKVPAIEYHSRVYMPSIFNDDFKDLIEYSSTISRCSSLGARIGDPAGSYSDFYDYITVNCASIVNLVEMAYNEAGKFNFDYKRGRLLLLMADSNKYIAPSNAAEYEIWKQKNAYSYQLLVPKASHYDRFNLMQEDLKRYFRIDVHIQEVTKHCLVMIRTSDSDKLKTKGGIQQKKFYRVGLTSTNVDSVRFFKNAPFRFFSDWFKGYYEFHGISFIDETGYTDNIDISIPGDIVDKMDLTNLRKALNKYDLDIVEKQCQIKVLVIENLKK